MVESVEMAFGMSTRGAENHLLDGGLDPPREGALLGAYMAGLACGGYTGYIILIVKRKGHHVRCGPLLS